MHLVARKFGRTFVFHDDKNNALNSLIVFCARLLLIPALSIAVRADDKPSLHTIYRSNDRGRSWSRSDNGLPGNARINALAASGDSFFAGTDAGIFTSSDEGRTWRAVTGLATNVGRVTSFATQGDSVFAGTDRVGVLASFDLGRTWKSFSHAAGPRVVWSLLWREGKLYAGTDTNDVFESSDRGESWIRFNEGLPGGTQIFALAAIKERLFAGLYSRGLYWWDPEKRRWVKAGRVLPLTLASLGDTLVAGHNPGGVFWSEDLGTTWHPERPGLLSETPFEEGGQDSTGIGPDAPIWSLAADDEMLIAGAAGGIYYSHDKARTWVRARHGLPAVSPGISFVLEGNVILAGTIVQGTVSDSRSKPSDRK